jgi:hypothetical protein
MLEQVRALAVLGGEILGVSLFPRFMALNLYIIETASQEESC